LQELKDLGPWVEIPAGQLTDNKRMYEGTALRNEFGNARTAATEMGDPDRGIDEDRGYGANHGVKRRRRPAVAFGSHPPKAINRCPAALSIKALRPACIKAVFSLIPVSSEALCTSSSCRLSVVLMHIYMH
jgi:hypothetical protein